MNEKIIVAGTTHDYIKIIADRYPGRAVFLTEATECRRLETIGFSGKIDIVESDLSDHDKAFEDLKDYIAQHQYRPAGIACYDCESMLLASRLADKLGLPYPDERTIQNTRVKYATKQIWEKNGITCPRARLLRTPGDVLKFHEEIQQPLVLKPLTGSGSELVFLCETKLDCLRAVKTMTSMLADHHNQRMYASYTSPDSTVNPRQVLEAEEYIKGREYSCDFIIDGRKLEIIRIARKYPLVEKYFGTTIAYLLPVEMPGDIKLKTIQKTLKQAALALGIKRAMVMVDFIIRRGRIYMLEMTPRPGGDCLPDLIYRSCGFDILGAALDFAAGRKISVPAAKKWEQLVGLRLFAPKDGIIKNIDLSSFQNDNRIVSSYLKAGGGSRVILPPENYDTRILGHVIFKPRNKRMIAAECQEISDKINLEMEASSWATASR